MSKLTAILLLVLSSIGPLCAQKMDTLFMDLERNAKLILVIENLNQLDEFKQINSLTKRLNDDVQRLQSDIQTQLASKVFYQLNEDGKRTIKIEQPSEKVVAAYLTDEEMIKGKNSPDSIFVPMLVFDEEGEIQSRKKIIFVVDYLEDLTEISTIDIDKRLLEITEEHRKDPGNKAFFATKSNWIYPIKLGEAGTEMPTGGIDYLSFHSTGGLSFIRNKWVPDLGFRLRLNLSSKDQSAKIIIGAGMTWHAFFTETEDGNRTDVNTFVSLFGRYSLKDGDNLEAVTIGLGIGYLTKNRGNYFGENTFKIYAPFTLDKSNISFTPELYFTDKFETVFPGFRIGVGF